MPGCHCRQREGDRSSQAGAGSCLLRSGYAPPASPRTSCINAIQNSYEYIGSRTRRIHAPDEQKWNDGLRLSALPRHRSDFELRSRAGTGRDGPCLRDNASSGSGQNAQTGPQGSLSGTLQSAGFRGHPLRPAVRFGSFWFFFVRDFPIDLLINS